MIQPCEQPETGGRASEVQTVFEPLGLSGGLSMNRHVNLLAVAILLTFAVGVAANTDADQDLLKKLESYRQWARLTSKPIIIDRSSLVG